MQPTFIPWAGYFALIHYVDKFVFLDNVQFNDRSWQQRNRIYSNGNVKWMTVPVIKKNYRSKKISEIKINHNEKFYDKHLKNILQSYTKAKKFKENRYLIESLYSKKFNNLSELNIFIIKKIFKYLNIKSEFFNASEIQSKEVRSNLLLQICKNFNCNEYISPQGSKIYLENDKKLFFENKIKITYFEYEPQKYETFYDQFIPNLSVIDLILNCGKLSKNIITDGILNT